MRKFINLLEQFLQDQVIMETPDEGYYMHITPFKNLKSIMQNGLVPNHNGGNYSKGRWISLDGVYASRNGEHLYGIRSGQYMYNILVIFVFVAKDDALPDEDIIEALLRDILDRELMRHDLALYQIADMDITENKQLWHKIAQEFHRRAHGEGEPPDFLNDLVETWAEFEIYDEANDIDYEFWGNLKDKTVRFYHDMAHPRDGKHSLRVPNRIGFEGKTRITGIIAVDEEEGDAYYVYGEIPEEGRKEFEILTNIPADRVLKKTSNWLAR